MPSITFVVFTYNEEKRITRVIQNFLNFGAVLVVDNYSTDGTVEIAKTFGCAVLLNKNQGWVEDPITTSRVKEAVTTPWIYWAYADEMLDVETLRELQGSIRDPNLDVITMQRKNYYYGKFCHNAYAHRMPRAFRKPAIDFSKNTIHHFGEITVPAKRVKHLPANFFVHHFISNTAKSYLGVMDRYTDIEATERESTAQLWKVLVGAGKSFIGNYFYRQGYKAGSAGLFICLLQTFYPILALMKKYEQSNDLNIKSIELINDTTRTALLLKINDCDL